MLALRKLADLFLLLYLGGRAAFSTATNNLIYSNFNNNWTFVAPGRLSTSSYFASQASKFSYTIPYGQPQECDIYGPLCQTGSITVTVNLINVTTATVLPCSSYLTLQSYYLKAPVAGVLYEGPSLPQLYADHWYTSFGRSPQCTSLAQAYSRGQVTLSNCGNRDTVIKTDLWSVMHHDGTDPGDISSLQQPPGVLRQFDMNYLGTCCGDCVLDISEGRLYYFPDSTSTDCSSDETYNSTLLSAGNLGRRAESIIANANIAVVSGNTLFVNFSYSISTRNSNSHCSTSPSLYFQVLGTVGLRDECDTVGPILTNPIVTFPSGGLSTWKPPPPTDSWPYEYGLGKVWRNDYAWGAGLGNEGVFAPLDVKDLACPTWGLGRSTASNGSVITTIGPPFLPLLMPNTQMFSLDPTWARICTAINIDTYANNQTFIIFDPPMALTPKAMMVPTSDNAPKLTPRPNPVDSTTMADPPVTSSTNPARPESGLVNPQRSPTNAGDLSKGVETTKPSPVQPKFPEPVFPLESQRHPTGLSPSPNGNPNKPSEASKTQPASPLESTDLVFQQEDSRHSQTQGLGAMIYNALGKSGNKPVRDTGNVNTITLPNAGVQEVYIAGTRILSVDPLGVQVDGVVYPAGGPPLTFFGKVFTFVPQPNNNDRYSDRSSELPSEPSNDPRPFSSPLSTVGQLITLNRSRMLVAGSTILPRGRPITRSNTLLSLDSSGILLCGSLSILLSPQSVFTI